MTESERGPIKLDREPTESEIKLRKASDELEQRFRKELEARQVFVIFQDPEQGMDSVHYFVVSPRFEGKSSRQRMQLMYSVSEEFDEEHDIMYWDYILLTPEENDRYYG